MKKNIVIVITLAILCFVGGTAYGDGYKVTNDLWIRAVINTVEKGPVDAVWQKGGEDTTSRGGEGECWKVRNTETGEIGYVRANRMKKAHHIYKEKPN
jgi:hypothetical protein